ncbi:hypothetical protein NQ318_014178 [Aromia moschata]|uniref:Cytochrome c oxidase subunit 7C, mitochondrial n=1 Tax=Aromia moschata TaxID=1265417 RepID=A0AAV8YA09_9CUCU|nr:hypothetical protein NQ318_014178 [Aromia moschata]
MIGKSSLFLRNTFRSLARYHDDGGVPGGNLPFSLTNRYKLTAYFVLFFGSGFGAPFLILRHQLLKK